MTDAATPCRCYTETPPSKGRAKCRLCGRVVGMPVHECHADGCSQPVPPRMFMCHFHWSLVPPALKREVWSAYVPGQETRKDPTDEYIEVARAAIEAVRRVERSMRRNNQT